MALWQLAAAAVTGFIAKENVVGTLAVCFVGLQFATGFAIAFLVYQIGTLITAGHLGNSFIPGMIVIIVFAGVIIYLIRRTDKNLAEEYKLSEI